MSDLRRTDMSKLARGRPSLAGIRDQATQRLFKAMSQTEDYLLRKVMDIREVPEKDKLPRTDVSKIPTKKKKAPIECVLIAADWVAPTSASIEGKVNNMGLVSEHRYNYGTTPVMGTLTDWETLAASGVPVVVATMLGALTVPATYYIQLSCKNAKGKAWSNVLQFDTGKKPDVTV